MALRRLTIRLILTAASVWPAWCAADTAQPPATKVDSKSEAIEKLDVSHPTIPEIESRSGIESSVSQWPDDPRARAMAMHERLLRVADVLNQASGRDITVRFNQTGRGGLATGEGTVYVDFALVWRVSEDALAALLAHEYAHELLGHSAEMKRLQYFYLREPNRMQRLREIERQADAYAGRLLAETDYEPKAFRDLLDLAQDTEWADPQMRTYYPNDKRIKTLMESYTSARQAEPKKKAIVTQTASQSDLDPNRK
jgi:hypothetical protein